MPLTVQQERRSDGRLLASLTAADWVRLGEATATIGGLLASNRTRHQLETTYSPIAFNQGAACQPRNYFCSAANR